MKKLYVTGLLMAMAANPMSVMAQGPVYMDLENGQIQNIGDVGIDELETFDEASYRGLAVSVGLLIGVNPEDGSLVTNHYALLPVMVQSVHAADMVDAGYFVGDGSLIMNLDADSISTGRLAVARLPETGVWDLSSMTLLNPQLSGEIQVGGAQLIISTNLVVQGVISGDGSGLTNVPAAGSEGTLQYHSAGQLTGHTNFYMEVDHPVVRGAGGHILRAYRGEEATSEQLIFSLAKEGVHAVMRFREGGQDTLVIRGDGSLSTPGALHVGSLSIGTDGSGDYDWVYPPAQGDLSMGVFTQE